jgi:hypothetical protein
MLPNVMVFLRSLFRRLYIHISAPRSVFVIKAGRGFPQSLQENGMSLFIKLPTTDLSHITPSPSKLILVF